MDAIAVTNINTTVFRAVLDAHLALVRGLRQLFRAETQREEAAARVALLTMLLDIEQREKGTR